MLFHPSLTSVYGGEASKLGRAVAAHSFCELCDRFGPFEALTACVSRSHLRFAN